MEKEVIFYVNKSEIYSFGQKKGKDSGNLVNYIKK